jgi:antirestriction protein ArdC
MMPLYLKKLDTEIDCLRVLIHEIAHATGAAKRLNRPTVATTTADLGAQASHFYAIEEVVADTTAALVLEYYGLANNFINLKIDLYVAMQVRKARLTEFAIAQAKRDAVGAFNYIIEHFAPSIETLQNNAKVNEQGTR